MRFVITLQLLILAISLSAADTFERSDAIRLDVVSVKAKDGAGGTGYSPGQAVAIKINLNGFSKMPGGEYDVQSDFTMSPGNSKTVIDRGRIIEQKIMSRGNRPITLSFDLRLAKTLKTGTYRVTIYARDKAGKKFNSTDIPINVR